MRTCLIMIVLSLVMVPGCSVKNKKKIEESSQFKVFGAGQMADAAEYSRIHGGSGVLVLQNGAVIYENYHNGADFDTPTHIHSGTKGFFGALTAVALQQGVFDHYDENISETITEWQNGSIHPGKDKVTLRHLVSLTSGLSQDLNKIGGDEPSVGDLYRYAVDNLRLNRSPGSRFGYGPSSFYVYGEFLKRKLEQAGIEQDPLEYLKASVFDKIGLEYASWVYDQAGNPHIPNGSYLTPRNWVKFGQLLLQRGRWNGVQIIEEHYVNALLEPGDINPGFGTFLWLNRQGGYPPFFSESAPSGAKGGLIFFDGYTDIIACLGAGKNRMYIIPSLNAVVVRQTLENSDDFSDNEFLGKILPK